MRCTPDCRLDKIYEIDRKLMEKLGIRALILDIDNTLTTHGNPVPAEGVTQWIERMRKQDVPMVIVSNNSHHRVKPFADALGLGFIAGGKKPLRSGLRLACEQMGVRPQETGVVGDQLFTDILGGNRMGMKTILVTPFELETGRFFRIKRGIERRMMRNYKEIQE
ncbi:YqeG family HAD IIIA-type phosphatase [Candidatus Soleaferrea massiliensis]|uniref:YqeG family HAD IIIA-type phosphatase n=1 Tax=Candidatus Soleaferrea massiliensis TaxID=1470354 RepID=UPI00058CDD48|nr:YqeG family HAD IIIA-type phosphatase [Candidatus Soleaferrea massiliensis]